TGLEIAAFLGDVILSSPRARRAAGEDKTRGGGDNGHGGDPPYSPELSGGGQIVRGGDCD
ncbi:hypothetical protein K0U00_46330, partial [Paenibacillus sepulcri]|nr:hypothetical protein [Paenibacillus sepulcri]